MVALPALHGLSHVTLVSPVFVWALLARISGIPMLEGAGGAQVGQRSRVPSLQGTDPCPTAKRQASRPSPGLRLTLRQHARATLCTSAIGLGLTSFSLPLVILACAKLAAPQARILTTAMNGIYRRAVAFDDWCLMHIAGVRWELPELHLDPRQTCLVICNHRSWCDVLVVQSLIARTGPVVTFLTKRELAFVPVFGIIFWAFRFPLLKRPARGTQSEAARRESDRQRILAACVAVREAPAAILAFAEGTRFSPAKRERMHSPYGHLLPAETRRLHRNLRQPRRDGRHHRGSDPRLRRRGDVLAIPGRCSQRIGDGGGLGLGGVGGPRPRRVANPALANQGPTIGPEGGGTRVARARRLPPTGQRPPRP